MVDYLVVVALDQDALHVVVAVHGPQDVAHQEW
jgi:hypothetical protein